MHGTAEGASDTRECDHPAHPDRTGAAIRGARRFLLKRAMLAERERVSNFNHDFSVSWRVISVSWRVFSSGGSWAVVISYS